MNQEPSFIYLLLNVDKAHFVYDLPPNKPLILNENAQVGIKNLFLWYTYPNISPKYNNNFIIINDEKHMIPQGMYDINSLNKFLKEINPNISLKVNHSTFKCEFVIENNDTVDLREGELNRILGFEPSLISGNKEGEHMINITRGVDRILIRCNLIERPYQEKYKDCLYDILPIASPGEPMHENVENVEYHRCIDRVIRTIEIRITDLHNKLIELGESMTIKLVFKH